MILVADSGSTKADWVAGRNGKVENSCETMGFNPFFHDREIILKELFNNKSLEAIRDTVDEVYFFGAGCSSPERNEIVRLPLTEFFRKAKVTVDHDMLGSAIAVCEGKPGIACILGTGSNICYFDGIGISETRHGLGYVLGDEGSGSYYGKKLLAWYIYGILPKDLETEFRKTYQLGKEDIIHKVYRESNPNVFLASFAEFLSDHYEHSFIKNLIHTGMTEFFETNVLSYLESRSVPVHFVGSIAYFFKDILLKVAAEKSIVTGNIIRKPVIGLASYFLNGGRMPGL